MKTLVITGASSGLGQSLANLAFAEGWKVVGLCRSRPDVSVIWIPTDLTKEADVVSATERIKNECPDFSLLIHCAGDGEGEPVDGLDYGKSEDVFRLNVIAPMVLTSRLLPLVRKNEADIVHIGATIAFKPYKYLAAYGASKWGFRGWTENLRLELKDTRCRLLDIHPGGMETKGNGKRMDQISNLSGKAANSQAFMIPSDVAKTIWHCVNLPKNMEVSEMVINRK